jgi:hypothetical protein
LKDSYPPDDAFMIRKLREAGAIVLAKTNMAEWAFSPRQTVSSSYGRTANAYDINFVPGVQPQADRVFLIRQNCQRVRHQFCACRLLRRHGVGRRREHGCCGNGQRYREFDPRSFVTPGPVRNSIHQPSRTVYACLMSWPTSTRLTRLLFPTSENRTTRNF